MSAVGAIRERKGGREEYRGLYGLMCGLRK